MKFWFDDPDPDPLDEVFHEAMVDVLAGFDEQGEWIPPLDGCDRQWLNEMGVEW